MDEPKGKDVKTNNLKRENFGYSKKFTIYIDIKLEPPYFNMTIRIYGYLHVKISSLNDRHVK